MEFAKRFIAASLPRAISRGSAICSYAINPKRYPNTPPATDAIVATSA